MEYRVSNVEELVSVINMQQECRRIYLQKGNYEICSTIMLHDNTEIIGEDGVNLYGSKRIRVKDLPYKDGFCYIKLQDYGILDYGSFGEGPYRDFWKEYDVPKPHMEDYGPSLELYMGDVKMNLSRYPQSGFLKIKKAVGPTAVVKEDGTVIGSEEGVFVPSDTEIFNENDVEQMLLVGYWNVDWATQRHVIEAFDSEKGIITVKKPYHTYGYSHGAGMHGEVGGKFYILNVKSCVKNPGDWYIDREKGEIFFIPYENQEYVDIAVCDNMFWAKGAKNLMMKAVNISRCRKSAIHFENCDRVSVSDCKIYNVGAWGVIADNCNETVISGCHIYNTGGGGIACSGGDRKSLMSGKNLISGNTIHDVAYWHRTYLAAIEINGVNVVVSENKIYDVPHFAIVFQGNDHIMEKNDISNACYESNDAGAIYAGRDYTCRGNVIRYNFLHDITGYENRGCAGIHFDDGMSSAEVYGNIFSNFSYVAVKVVGGRDFDIYHNFFYHCCIAMKLNDRLKNVFPNARHMLHLDEVPYRSEIWQKAYPQLYHLLEDEPGEPKYNRFCNNTVVGGYGIALTSREAEKYLEHHDNVFVDAKDCEIPFVAKGLVFVKE